MWQTIFKRMILWLRLQLRLFFSLVAHWLSWWNGPPQLGRPKCTRLWVCLRIMSLIMDDLTGVGLLRLQLLDYCQFIYFWAWIYSLFLYIAFSLLLKKMYDTQRGASYLKYINIDIRNPSFASFNMDLV